MQLQYFYVSKVFLDERSNIHLEFETSKTAQSTFKSGLGVQAPGSAT